MIIADEQARKVAEALAARCGSQVNRLARELAEHHFAVIPHYAELPEDMRDLEITGTARRAIQLFLKVAAGTPVTVTVRFHTPSFNNGVNVPKVDHVDLITGEVTGKKDPADAAAWGSETNPSAAVAKRFTGSDWTADGEYLRMTYTFTPTASTYLRLRGTNQALGSAKLDANGEPLMDEADTTSFTNTLDEAWADLWFYSNPVFVTVR